MINNNNFCHQYTILLNGFCEEKISKIYHVTIIWQDVFLLGIVSFSWCSVAILNLINIKYKESNIYLLVKTKYTMDQDKETVNPLNIYRWHNIWELSMKTKRS